VIVGQGEVRVDCESVRVEIGLEHLRPLGIEDAEIDVRTRIRAIRMSGESGGDAAIGEHGHLFAVNAKRHVATSQFVDQLAARPEDSARVRARTARQCGEDPYTSPHPSVRA